MWAQWSCTRSSWMDGSVIGASRRRRPASCGRRVRVVVVPPPIRWGLRVALGRVLPLLLATQRRDVEVVPRVPHLLVPAGIDEVGAEDPTVLANECVRSVPLVDAEVLVEV